MHAHGLSTAVVTRRGVQPEGMAYKLHVSRPTPCAQPPQMAELLGFDPDLVMAELARLQAAEAGEQQAQEQQQPTGGEGSA